MRKYTPEQVAEIASRYLRSSEIPRVVVASLRRPGAFSAVDGLLEGMLARRFLEIADQVLNEGENDG